MIAVLRALSLVAGFICFTAAGQAQLGAPDLPTETDTLQVGRTVVLSNVKGEIFKKGANGNLLPLASGASIEPGEVILVRRGASFSIGRTQFGPENHGDRWVQFK
jgi:hypothetical protein